VAKRFVDGDLLRRAAAFDFASQYLPNLSNDVIVTN